MLVPGRRLVASGLRTLSDHRRRHYARSLRDRLAEILIAHQRMLPRQVLPRQFYLITRRCCRRQFLLRPDAATNNAFLYCLIAAALRPDRSAHADGDGQRGGVGKRPGLRRVVPGELGLGWVARGCEGRGGGGKPERDEQAVRSAGIGDECHDAAAAAARAGQNVLGEHPAQQVGPR